MMYAVFRETHYAPHLEVVSTAGYQEFHSAHAAQLGYRGTVVADVGEGRLLTVTLWATAEAMAAARDALGPVVARTLDPLMTAPAVLLGTGRVVVNDLAPE
jgi:heme-degrading monooxygenase HmoA